MGRGVWHETLVAALEHWRRVAPERVAFRLLSHFGDEVEEISFSRLHRDALAVASGLSRVAAPGSLVALVFSSNADFVRAFFGCLSGGFTPVPALPPSPRGMDRASSIVKDCSPAIVLTSARLAHLVERRTAKLNLSPTPLLLSLEDTLSIEDGPKAIGKAPTPSSDDIALVQYTSGSTSSPRGVVVSHGNLVHNCRAMALGFGFDERSLRPVSWLPLFHDMGLAGHVVTPVYFGATSTLLSTLDFLQQPGCWLSAIGEFGGTFSLAPNFAYDLCVERVLEKERKDLDLSSWRWAANGAEPIRPDTMRRFHHTFGYCGFEMRDFYPGYGLAEATLFVSGGPRRANPVTVRADQPALKERRVVVVEGSVDGVELVSSGRVRRDSRLEIVDPDLGVAMGDGMVGEIWLRGPSVARGYLGDSREDGATFGATLDGDGPFLRTGDLGFTLDGHLFVCGRLKDLIILNGLNHYPQDLEQTVNSCHESIKNDSAVAFAVEIDNREALVVTCEIGRRVVETLDQKGVVGAMRERLAEEHGVRLREAVLLREGATPRTTSGKVRRTECRRLFEQGGLKEHLGRNR